MAGVSYIGYQGTIHATPLFLISGLSRKPISLVSLSDIRYRGILHGIDPANSTISLANGKPDRPFLG